MKKSIKRAGASVLIAALAFSAFVLPKTMAAIAVDTDASCTMEINVGKNVGGNYSELNTKPVEIDLYKVASVDVTGDFTADAGYETLEGDLAALDDKTTAEDWATISAKAKALIDAEGSGLAPVKNVATSNGSVTVTDLETGLYLVDPQTAWTDYYQYDFTPYLISLPDNRYYDNKPDTWIYELTGDNAIGLKPIRTDRYGDLVIEKFLDSYNATNVGATFVFQVEGTKTDVDTGEVKTVISDVYSMTFNGPGEDRIVIEDIPAGANVTVTEVYSGGSYKLTSDRTVDTVIVAEQLEDDDAATLEGVTPAVPNVATVEFSNTYDETHTGGTGLVNQFTYDSENDKWTHSTP